MDMYAQDKIKLKSCKKKDGTNILVRNDSGFHFWSPLSFTSLTVGNGVSLRHSDIAASWR